MKLATWNVNSVRARRDRLLEWLGRIQPDVLCLQELKAEEELFPLEDVRALGYHALLHAQRAYNGVGILSRLEITEPSVGLGDGVDDLQARLIAATIGDIRILSAYVPNGQVVGSDKWLYKLEWIRRLRAHLDATYSPDQPLALCGDFNIAPEDRDVARPDEWRASVLCHEEARQALRELTSWGLTDGLRLHHEGPGPYSWWDYRMLAFPKGNGLRLDHVFITRPLVARCTSGWVDREQRKGKLPSDHAPVLVDLVTA